MGNGQDTRMLRSFGMLAAGLLLTAPWVAGQKSPIPVSQVRILSYSASPASNEPAPSSPGTNGEVLREIDDPHTGDCWLLTRDASHPAGPGRLVLVSAGHGPLPPRPRPGDGAGQVRTVIHSGDRVVVEEHSLVADARFEAVALSPAFAGSNFNVRLVIGGQILRAMALGPGRAVIPEAIQ